jgi:hypothetical protein
MTDEEKVEKRRKMIKITGIITRIEGRKKRR